MEISANPHPSETCFPTPPSSTLPRICNPFRIEGNVGINSILNRFKVPNYVWCAFFTGIGGFLFGFDTGSIGPITIMPDFQERFSNRHTGVISPTVQGLIVSSILITASLASVVSGPLSDRISRTRTIALGAITFSVGSAIACAAYTLPQIFVGRCIAGVGEGLFLSVVTVYAVEIAPASSRGRLGSVVQLLITIGIATGLCLLNTCELNTRYLLYIFMLGYFVCFGTSRVPSSFSWRFPLGMQAGVSAVLAVGSPFLTHSPRWLRHVGRGAEADMAWVKLGVRGADAEKTEETANREETRTEGWWKETQQLWDKDVRKRTGLGVFLMMMMNVRSNLSALPKCILR